jgi:hypothetical protein
MLGEERQHAQNQCGTGLALESPVKSQATVHAGGPRAPRRSEKSREARL